MLILYDDMLAENEDNDESSVYSIFGMIMSILI